jgi:hypothetical protein
VGKAGTLGMVNLDAVRRLLTVADVNGNPYVVAEVAGSLLAADETDAMARGFYARALSALKLVAAAQRAVGENTAQSTIGIIPWKSRARRFAANLSALAQRDAAGAKLVEEAAQGLEQFELHGAGDGNYQILDSSRAVHAGWLGGFKNHKSMEGVWAFDRTKPSMPVPMAFEGIGLGWLFLEVLRSTERSYLNYSCALYVIEGDPLALAMVMHLHDLQDVIQSERVRWFVGQNAEEATAAFRKGLGENQTWSVPEQFVRGGLRAGAVSGVEAVVKEIKDQRAAKLARDLEEARRWYADKTPAYWQQRFEAALSGKGEKLRVLGVTSRYTTVLRHSMMEMQAAVAAWGGGGHEMRVAIEPDDSSAENLYTAEIAAWKPDLIFQISRMRYENPQLPGNVPFVCWDQDNLPCMRTEKATTSLDALTYVAGHGAAYGYTFLGWPRRNVIFCELAGATHRYSGQALPEEMLAAHRCDVSFISNASGTPAEMRGQQRGLWRKNVTAGAIYEEVSSLMIGETEGGRTWEHYSILAEIRRASDARGVRLTANWENELVMALVALSDRCFRHTALQWVRHWCEKAGRSLRLYGQGWEKHPDFAKYAAGYAQQGDGLAAIYQASRINLHLMESGGFFHSRPLDGLAAGGFLLTRTSPNDGAEEKYVRAQRVLAERAGVLGLVTKGDLERCTDAAVVEAWGVMRHYFAEMSDGERIPGLTVWGELLPARVVFPELVKISFSSAGEFETLAERYLSNESERAAVARTMQETVRREMSYSRRWGQFIEGVQNGLVAATNVKIEGAAEILVA